MHSNSNARGGRSRQSETGGREQRRSLATKKDLDDSGRHYPEMKIMRAVNIKALEDSSEWNRYLNNLAQNNLNKAKVRALGSMGITYYGVDEITKMYTNQFGLGDYKTVLKNMRSIASRFNRFVQANGESTRNEWNFLEDINPENLTSWVMGDFEIEKNLKQIGDNDRKMGHMIKPHGVETFDNELSFINTHLRQRIGLAPDNRQRAPWHLTVFDETRYPIGSATLNSAKVEIPKYIPLLGPQMLVIQHEYQV